MERVYEVASRTPLELAPTLSARVGNRVWLKREDQQPVHSFKLRGAYAMMASLSADELSRGVVAASAGNHAQGVALAARRLGTSATIVVPNTAPPIKIAAIRGHGANVVIAGDTYDDAFARAKEIEVAEGRVFVPPFDHPLVIAGQGTVGEEIAREAKSLDAVFVAVGGGGLI
ncbi:pyridoxal-phosphate dependent enzyme, partial [bacterium]